MATPLRVLTRAQLDQYHRDGFLTVPGVFAPAAMDRALEACDQLNYGMDYATWRRRVQAGEPLPLLGGGVSANFPTGIDALDELVENTTYLDIACDLLGTDDLHYINGHLFVRAGPIDSRYSEHPWQGFHIDRASASFLPPHSQEGCYDYVGSGVLLHDVDEGCAPTVMLPGTHRRPQDLLPRLFREGIFIPPNVFSDIRSVPEFQNPVSLTGSKGSASFNCTNLVHGAVPFKDRTQQRAFWTMSFGRRSEGTLHRHGNVLAGELRERTVKRWSRTSARVRSLFDWPNPGDAYYTPETLEMLALWYPDMDLSEYRAALSSFPVRSPHATLGGISSAR